MRNERYVQLLTASKCVVNVTLTTILENDVSEKDISVCAWNDHLTGQDETLTYKNT